MEICKGYLHIKCSREKFLYGAHSLCIRVVRVVLNSKMILCSYRNWGLFRVPSLGVYAARLNVCVCIYYIYAYMHTHIQL